MKTRTIMILVLAAVVMSARGDSISWDGSTDTDWSEASNWNTGDVPGTNDTAYLGVNGASTSGQKTFISGGDAAAVSYLIVANSENFEATLTITGLGSTLTLGVNPYVGNWGNGILNVLDGGSLIASGSLTAALVESTTSSGAITVDGTGSTINVVGVDLGSRSSATMDITGGGVVAASGSSRLGLNTGTPDGTAVVTVDGSGSEFRITGDLTVSMGGDASLDITSIGLVSVGGIMSIQTGNDNGVVRMSTGGQLALSGSVSDLTGFYGLIAGQDNIEYWNGSAWVNLTAGTRGTDYGFTAGSGDLSGYTVLTVPALPPAGMVIQIQ